MEVREKGFSIASALLILRSNTSGECLNSLKKRGREGMRARESEGEMGKADGGRKKRKTLN